MQIKPFSKILFQQKWKPIPSTPKAAALLLLLGTLCITGIVYLITTTHFYLIGNLLLQHPDLLLLNLLPVIFLLLFTFFLTGRRFFSISLTGAVCIILAVAHRIKVSMRQEPLLPSDLRLVKEAFAIVKTFPTSQIVLIAVLILGLLTLLLFCLRREKQSLLSLPLRLIWLSVVVIGFFGANDLWYMDKELYESYPTIENPNQQLNQYNAKGFLYSFLHQYHAARIKSPVEYSSADFAALEDTDWTPPDSPLPKDQEYPHIVMIMGEAFSDLSENDHLDFTEFRDPLENWKKICSEKDTVSGHIIVPNFGGGTSNTEYDVLTGCGTRYLDSAEPGYSLIQKPFDGIPHQLKLLGYDTLAIHPGNEWFYNRQHVYPNLGFDTCYFLEDSFDLETQGVAGYINEVATFDKIIETLDTHIQKEDTPLFSFTVTIQNHGPYERKFGYVPTNFSTDIPLDAAQTDLLTQYFHGITSADEQIGRLKEYAEASEEPIVLVYFGDHLPGITGSAELFHLLDYPIDAEGSGAEQLGLFKTPYFIWQNDSAKMLASNQTAEEIAFPADGLISSQFLGTTVLELFLPQYESMLHRYNDRLRRELPVCTRYIYVDKDGTYLSAEQLSSSQREMVTLLKKWQYYKLYDQKKLPQSPFLNE